MLELHQAVGELVDGVVRDGQGAVAAGVGGVSSSKS